MDIFRLQRRYECNGPFSGETFSDVRMHCPHVFMPPYTDMNRDYDWWRLQNDSMHNHLCACSSLEQLAEWFGNKYLLAILDDYDFELVKLTLSQRKVRLGKDGKQVFYNPKDVSKTVSFPVMTLTKYIQ